ncbi:MAG: hypothetical protein M3N12_00855 [Verrucomicrobiota bacterium]|nr:hypothetical protein [Verrucomicrobiota bacterium]
MNYRRLYRFIALFTLALAITPPASFAGGKKKKSAAALPTPPPLIETTGSILGVTLFEPLEEAREKLAKYKLVDGSVTSESGEKEEEEEQSERAVWRLAETEYQWIVAWADKQGKVVKISASVRPEKKKPFAEIGDLGRAKMHNDSTALWIVQRPDGTSYRLVAKGPAGHAVTIYLYSLTAAPIN